MTKYVLKTTKRKVTVQQEEGVEHHSKFEEDPMQYKGVNKEVDTP
jgi:hypothetical protein